MNLLNGEFFSFFFSKSCGQRLVDERLMYIYSLGVCHEDVAVVDAASPRVPMTAPSSAQLRCAQNIAFLYFLGQVHAPPRRNIAPHNLRSKNNCESAPDGALLLLSAEMDLTKTLAFLSSLEDDMNQITAVCVAEKKKKGSSQEGQGLEVLVAANARGPVVTVYLEKVKSEFDGLFSILRRAMKSECRPMTLFAVNDDDDDDDLERLLTKTPFYSITEWA
jgi:hypothetical protein